MNPDEIADRIIAELDLSERAQRQDSDSFELEVIDRAMKHFVAEKLKTIDCYAISDPASNDDPEIVDIVKTVWSKLRGAKAGRD